MATDLNMNNRNRLSSGRFSARSRFSEIVDRLAQNRFRPRFPLFALRESRNAGSCNFYKGESRDYNRFAPFEALEARVLMSTTGLGPDGDAPDDSSAVISMPPRVASVEGTGQISGVKFFDLDFDGFQDVGPESGLGGFTIYLDTNNNNQLDGGEVSTVTDVQGNYSFTGLTAGTYNVAEVLDDHPDKWLQTSPGGPSFHHVVTLGSGDVESGINFGNVRAGAITGLVFNDLDGDGVQEGGEIGIAGRTIQLIDPSDDSVLSTTLTAGDGTYQFEDLLPVTYEVRQVVPAGWLQTSPTLPSTNHTAELVSGSVFLASDLDFGAVQAASIAGIVYNDLDGDGTRDGGEPGLQDWTVYLDANNNGTLDGQANATTTFNAADVPIAIPDGGLPITSSIQVNNAGTVVTDVNVRLTIQHEFNGDVDVFLISPFGTRVELFTDVGLDSDNFTNTVLDDEADFLINSGTAPYTGTFKPEGLLSLLDGESPNGEWQLEVRDDTPQQDGSLISWSLTLSTSTPAETQVATDVNGNYQITNLLPGSYTVRQVVESGFSQTSPAGNAGRNVTLSADEDETNINFGNEAVEIDGTLQVTNFTSTNSGFSVTFNRALDRNVLNLYDGQDASIDAADMTLVGQTTGAVRGSLTWDGATNTVHFVKTGGVLAADSYTVSLDSRSDGIVDLLGNQLDGNANGTAGDDYQNTFVINASSARVISLPDVVRGPGQDVNIPATDTDLPIRIDNGASVTRVELTFNFDPDLLTVTGATLGANIPGGWTLQSDLSVAGQATFTLFGATAISAGAAELLVLDASVPGTADYRASQRLTLTNVELNNGGFDAKVDDAIHKVAYLGDTTGNKGLSGLDASLAARVAVGLDTGFDSYATTDPVLLGDATGNGSLSSLDASFIARKSVSLAQPEIPDIPAGVQPVLASGPDPIIQIESGLNAVPGDTVNISLTVTDNVAGMQSADLTIDYDTTLIDLTSSDVTLGELMQGQGASLTVNVNDAAGRITISIFTLNPMPAGTGSILDVALHIPNDAPSGTTSLNLEGTLNEGGLTLTAIDGSLTVTSSEPQPGSISGLKFEDLDGDAVKDANEDGLQGWTIYLDANNNGQLDGGEVSVVTGADGTYTFADLDAGTYRVREVLQAGWIQTSPASGSHSVSLASGENETRNFGNVQTANLGSISGTKFNDEDGDGTHDAGEDTLQGWTIYLDANNNSQLDGGESSVVTDVNGNYTFEDLFAGTYRVREVLQAGWTQIAPAAGVYTINLAGAQDVADQDFGNQQLPPDPGSISGTKFEDLNGDGTQGAGEDGLQGWTIYLDANNNSQLDGGEVSVVTGANGTYTFTDLAAGAYRVREVLQQGWTQTLPAAGVHNVTLAVGQDVIDRDFGNQQILDEEGVTIAVTGGGTVQPGDTVNVAFTVTDDAAGLQSADLTFDYDTTLIDLATGDIALGSLVQGGTLTVNVNDATGHVTISIFLLEPLDAGAGTLLTLALHVPANAPNGATTLDLEGSLNEGTLVMSDVDGSLTVESEGVETGSISGLKFNDEDGDGVQDAGEDGLQGWTIFLDEDNDGQHDVGETSVVTDANGNYTFGNLAAGTYRVREVNQAGWTRTAPASGVYVVNLAAGQDVIDRDFGNQENVEGREIIGVFDANTKPAFTFVDIDGTTVTVTLKGPGTGTVVRDDDGNIDIELEDTTADSRLTVRNDAGGNGVANIDDFDITGSLNRADAKTTDLGGDFTISGGIESLTLRNIAVQHVITIGAPDEAGNELTLKFNDLQDVSIDSQTAIKSLTVASWNDTDGTDDLITAPHIDKITSKGDFEASLNLSGVGVAPGDFTLGKVSVKGEVNNSTWTIEGDVNSAKITGPVTGWTLDIDGMLNKLTVGDVANGAVIVDGPINSISAGSWLAGSITGDSLKKLKVKGDFDADLTLTGDNVLPGAMTLGSVSIGGEVNNSDWDITGDVKSTSIKGTVTGWDLDLNSSLSSLKLAEVASASIDVDGALGKVSATNWLSGSIASETLGSLATKGDLGADVTVRDTVGGNEIKSISVKGRLIDATIRSASNAKSLRFGAVVDSNVLFGVVNGFASNNGAIPDTADDFSRQLTINKVDVKGVSGQVGASFINSVISSWSILKASLRLVDTENEGEPLGLSADSVASYTRTTTNGKITLKDLDAAGAQDVEGDYSLNIL